MDNKEIEKINKLVDELLENGSVVSDAEYNDLVSIVSDIQEIYKQEEEIDLRFEINNVTTKMKKMGAVNMNKSIFSKFKNINLFHNFNYKYSLAVIAMFAVLIVGLTQFNNSNQDPIVFKEAIPSNVSLSYGGETNYGQDPYSSYIDVSFTNMSVDEKSELDRYIKFEPEIGYQTYALDQGRGFRIKPTASLEYGQEYIVRISKSIKMQDNQRLDNDMNFKFNVRPEMEVLCIKPSDKSDSVPLDSKVEIELSYMCADIANLNNLILFEPKIEGEFSVDKTKIVFTPVKLEPSTTYKIIVKKELKNEFGEGIPENIVSTFTTASN